MYAVGDNNSGNVPAFLMKLWTLVEDPSTDELIHWDSNGTSFHVYDQQRFSREILPLYFKHNNIASFIRQLNMYGFRKVTHIDQGGLKIEKDDLQFQHQYFQRGERDMLQFIKRKVSAQTVRTTDQLVAANTDEVSRALSEMKQVKSKQDTMDQNLEYIKRENKLLWREMALLRQKHHKQQQIVNKLIQFLVSLVSSNRTGLSIPSIRRVPLAINDVSQLAPNSTTNSQPTVSLQQGNNLNDNPKMSDYLLSPSSNINGLIIHELTDTPQTILVPVTNIPLVNQMSTVPQQSMCQPLSDSNQGISVTPNKATSVVLIPAAQSTQSSDAASDNTGNSLNFLMSPKIEAAPSLEDALTFGLNVPSNSNIISPTVTTSPQFSSMASQQKRKRKNPATNTYIVEPGAPPPKRSGQMPPVTSASARTRPVSDAQAASLNNIVMANSDLNFVGSDDASLAVANSKDSDDFTVSSNQLDLLSSDLDGLKGILQDQYKMDPSFLMELFDSSNPWPVIPEKDLDDLKGEHVKEEAGTSDLDHGNITGTELVEYNPRDELFPELLGGESMTGDIDDLD